MDYNKKVGVLLPPEFVNQDTGEIEPVTIIVKSQKTDDQRIREAKARADKVKGKSPYDKWSSINLSSGSDYMKMMSCDDLTLADKAVWHAYVGYIGLGNWVCTQQQIIARRVNCSRRLLTMSTKKLVELGFLERSRDTTCEYRIPKSMAYCGSWKLFNIDD